MRRTQSHSPAGTAGDRPAPTTRHTCPICRGAGGFIVERGYRVIGSGYGDAEPVERAVRCPECDGEGVLR